MASDNHTRILDLAITAIDSRGEAAVRVNHIVEAVGVTPPVRYHHFGSRNGLVITVQVERYTRRTFDDIAKIGNAVAKCTSRDQLRKALVITWTQSLPNCARSSNHVGSEAGYARE